MNRTNALGFFAVGLAFAVAPFVAPGLFPHTAIDGSSTRALWVEVMGAVQMGSGALALLAQKAIRLAATNPHENVGATTKAGWEGDHGTHTILVVERVATPEPEGSVTLHGAHAELWCAFNQALRRDGRARQLAARLVELSRQPMPTEGAVAFVDQRERELAEQAA